MNDINIPTQAGILELNNYYFFQLVSFPSSAFYDVIFPPFTSDIFFCQD